MLNFPQLFQFGPCHSPPICGNSFSPCRNRTNKLKTFRVTSNHKKNNQRIFFEVSNFTKTILCSSSFKHPVYIPGTPSTHSCPHLGMRLSRWADWCSIHPLYHLRQLYLDQHRHSLSDLMPTG